MNDAANIPPVDLEAERAVLGAMLVNPNAAKAVCDLLEPDDFYRESHRRIFAAISATEAPDVLTVSAKLPGDRDCIHTLAEFVPAATNAPHYAAVVKDRAVMRRLIRFGTEVAELGYRQAEDVQSRFQALAHEALHALDTTSRSLAVPEADAMARFMADLEERRQGKVIGLPWPPEWSALGRRLGPIEPASLTVVGGRPSSGKSLWALQLLRYLCGQGKRVLYMSRELAVERIMRRHACAFGATMLHLESGHLNDADNRAVAACADDAKDWEVFYDERGRTTADVRRETLALRPDLVIIDYLQRFAYDTEAEYAAITRIVNELQDLTLDTGVPVICLTQLSRPMKGAEHKAPSMSDVRGSGAVEERAANIILLHRLWEMSGGAPKSPTDQGWYLIEKSADHERGRPIAITYNGARMRILEATK